MIDYYKIKDKYNQKFGALSIVLPELVAIKFNLRKATEIIISDTKNFAEKYNFIKKICSFLNFYSLYYVSKGGYNVVIAKEELPPVNIGETENKDNRFFYPQCCIDKFKERSKYHFINNIKYLLEKPEYNFRINPFLRKSPFHLVKHLPCSLECAETLKVAGNLLHKIESTNPELYSHLIMFNQTPVFYTDICSLGISFIGIAIENKIKYQQFYFEGEPRELLRKTQYNTEEDCALFETLVGFLKKGNTFILNDNDLIIKKDEYIIGKLDKPALLVWKIINFV